MGLFAGRGKKRVAKGEVVAIARPDSLGLEHPATTENMSEPGLRLITEQGWKPGDRVLLTTAKTASRIPSPGHLLRETEREALCCRSRTFKASARNRESKLRFACVSNVAVFQTHSGSFQRDDGRNHAD